MNAKAAARRILATAPKSYRISDPNTGCEIVRILLETKAVFRSSSPGGTLNITVQFREPADQAAVEALLR